MQAKIFHATDHDIDHRLIDQDAIYVIHKLREAGYSAYMVGGSVRDLLIKKTPKDYDISTSARPEEIKQVFGRNCLLIGRRFRLAHVRFGHKIFEVSTFRSGDNESDLIIRDNVWGTPEEDVLRRDFTINGLFYDPSTHTVIDYVGGWEDIHQRILKTIGEPAKRFKQDPVRMLRLLKFQARYDFHVEEATQKALKHSLSELLKSSPARILEEIFRMLESGYSSRFLHLIHETGLLEYLFPCLIHFMKGKYGKEIHHFLEQADELNREFSKPQDRSVLTCSLLYPILEKEIKVQFLDQGIMPHIGEVMMVSSTLIKAFVTSSFSHFPKKNSSEMNFILSTQYRLTPLTGKKHPKAKWLHNKEFKLALNFLKIRAMVHKELEKDYDYWFNQYKLIERPKEKHNHFHHSSPKKNIQEIEEEVDF